MTQFITSVSLAIFAFFLDYIFKKKPKLRFFYGAISEIPFPPKTTNEQEKGSENTGQQDIVSPFKKPPSFRIHTVVITNQGNATAHNIRVGHYLLPLTHSVSPPMGVQNPSKPEEILIPVLCSKDVVTISYLYPKELHFSNINAYIVCDEGKAELANLQHVTIKSPWLIWTRTILIFSGIFTVIYIGYGVMNFFINLYKMVNG